MASRNPTGRSTVDDLLNQGFFKSTRATGGASPLPSPRASPLSGQGFFDARASRSHDVNNFSSPSSYNALKSEASGQINSSTAYLSPDKNVAPQMPPRASAESRMPTNYESTRSPTTYSSKSNHHPDSNHPSRSERRGPLPPRPTVEDEAVALAREVPSRSGKSTSPTFDDTPARGTVEQYPVILEADVSSAEAAKLDAKLRKEAKDEANAIVEQQANTKDPDNQRFVLVTDTHSSSSEREDIRSRQPRRTSTAPQSSKQRKSGSYSTRQEEPMRMNTVPGVGQPSRPNELRPGSKEPYIRDESRRQAPPPVERRRSRNEDLPTLQTKLAPRYIPLQRSRSAYTQDSCKLDSPRLARTPSADYTPSYGQKPASTPQAKDYDKQAFTRLYDNVPNRLETPVLDKRRSGGASPAHSPNSSRPSTPGSEKRWSAGEGLTHGIAKLTRPQELASDSQRHNSQSEGSERENRIFGSRKSSSSEHYYLSTDDELEDSSNSDRPRKSRHRKNHHNRHQHQNVLHPDDRDHHHHSTSKTNQTSLNVKPQSTRHASPHALPERSVSVSPSQLPSIDQREPRSDKEQRSSSARHVSPYSAHADARSGTLKPVVQEGRTRHMSSSTPQASRPTGLFPASLPIPVPSRIDLTSPGETRRMPSIPRYDDEVDPLTKSRPSNGAIPFLATTPSSQDAGWQRPDFVPQAQNHLDRSAGVFRRYSEDTGDIGISKLPECARTTAARGYNDWLTLPNCDGLNICPKCFGAFQGTPFASQFVRAPVRPPNDEIACDFGNEAWFRIAWVLVKSHNKKSLDSFYAIAEVVNREKPCMGKHFTKREWFSVLDPETGAPVRNFDVCKSCKLCIEAILPNLRGIFVDTTRSHVGLERMCDMRFDSKRFLNYFDALEVMSASKPHPRRGLDTYEFVDLARRYGTVPECPQLEDVTASSWWAITQLPEFTVCEECFEEVVRPALHRRRAIAAMFSRKERVSYATSCQLYSDRMRDHFDRAVDLNDYKFLAAKARDRKAKELAYKRDREQLRHAVKVGERGAREQLLALEDGWKRWE